MKNAAIIISSIILGVLALAIVMTIGGRTERDMELNDNLSSIVEETVDMLLAEKSYDICDRNEFVADMIENLSYVLDSESDITVNIEQADDEKGIMSVKVIVTYNHPNGEVGTVEAVRTVIFNKLDETEKNVCEVKFYTAVEGELQCYKKYEVLEGDTIPVPMNPVSAEATFTAWVDSDGQMVDFASPVTQDMCYYAIWQ